MTTKEKLQNKFTTRQIELMNRPEVTKSLVKAVLKVFSYKNGYEAAVQRWVGESTEKFLKVLPLITVAA